MAGHIQARRERTRRKTKMDELNQARKQINDSVDQLNRLGTSWIRSHGEERCFEDISTQLENSINLLSGAVDKMVDDILDWMDVFEKKGIAVHSQVGQVEETVSGWIQKQIGSEKRLTDAETYD